MKIKGIEARLAGIRADSRKGCDNLKPLLAVQTASALAGAVLCNHSLRKDADRRVKCSWDRKRRRRVPGHKQCGKAAVSFPNTIPTQLYKFLPLKLSR
jgi:hypothetical protein